MMSRAAFDGMSQGQHADEAKRLRGLQNKLKADGHTMQSDEAAFQAEAHEEAARGFWFPTREQWEKEEGHPEEYDQRKKDYEEEFKFVSVENRKFINHTTQMHFDPEYREKHLKAQQLVVDNTLPPSEMDQNLIAAEKEDEAPAVEVKKEEGNG